MNGDTFVVFFSCACLFSMKLWNFLKFSTLIFRLEVPIMAKNLQYPIHCVSATPDCTHIFACREDGNVIVVGS